MKIHKKCPQEFTKNVHEKIHPKRGLLMNKSVHENSPKVFMKIHPFYSQKFDLYVHQKSATPLVSSEIKKDGTKLYYLAGIKITDTPVFIHALYLSLHF